MTDYQIEGKKFNQLEMRSPAMQRLIAQKPSFLSRFSIIIFGVILLCLIYFSWKIQFQDWVTAPVFFSASSNSSQEQVYATAFVNFKDIKKIDTGQLAELTIRFNSDTSQRHFKGYISFISKILTNNEIEVKISIINPTDFSRAFQMQNHSVSYAKAKIITKSKSLIDKLLQDIFERSVK